MEIHRHPESGVEIAGLRLAPGAILATGDVYSSNMGNWEPCPVPGLRLENSPTLWVRPKARLSEKARRILAYLVQPNQFFKHISKGCCIPSPGYNWDGRLELPRLLHPECVKELTDYGFLSFGIHPVSSPHPDHSPSGLSGVNEVYSLTEEGKREGAKILTSMLN